MEESEPRFGSGSWLGNPGDRRHGFVSLVCYDAPLSFTIASVLSIVGLLGLTLGADLLVRGASRLATHFGIRPLLVGLTVVAYGTSAPEIVASVVAALDGHAEMTVGNVLGSNVANIGLILGLTAVVAPLAVARSVLKRELPLMVAVTFLFSLLALRLELGRTTGAFFIALMLLFNYLSFAWARAETPEPADSAGGPRPPQMSKLMSSSLYTLGGLALLLGGAKLLVSSAVSIARSVGLSEFVIGVTLVAIGTSLPELATAFVAGLRKEADLVVGTIVGSNMFNILGAIGISATLRPLAIDRRLLSFEFPALIAMTLLVSVFLYTGRRVVRWEGIVLLGSYTAFIALLFR